MKTIELKLYSFEELSEKAQNYAIDKYLNSSYPQEIDLSWLIEDFKDIADKKGFKNPKFQYSLGYCQGDGLSFSFDYFNTEQLAKIIQEKTGHSANWFLDIVINSIYSIYGTGNKGHYCYCNENQVILKDNINFEHKNLGYLLEEILEDIQEKYVDLCQDFYIQLQKQYEYETSKEYAREFLQDMDFQFLETGEIFNF